ncbi:Site-specific recombinase [Magnetospirillum sp. XM-1]|uniref:recombinase family protein n=1 Tax=Magnetospirillum sp. XM-1 TaxID=1663591 RepID=UPI00073DBD44|nr:recombinase family protein [Magnetospirillum sp. XM-1]CUW37167.1 Site-specific recombinase [Magnetospirillum sp. XM-1]
MIRAAEYVRMSTEHQQYSTENQSDAIRQYAARRGYTIVRTYADEGKSGLRLDGRDALKQLLGDVQTGKADYSVILVYDVSRWGRFQDADEAAHNEFVCRRAGIDVQYCAEPFENDGSFGSDIQKMLKRKMAGEYSRELSTKVFAGQCRLIEHGFRQGGPPGFGLRRSLIDQAGTPKGELERGEHKSIQTDRVVLVLGPPEEVETVKWMYRAFIEDGKPEREIAAILNRRGISTDLGRPWTRGTVHQVLINEKYVGNNVWNRISFKLKKKRIKNGPDRLVRADGVFDAIVDLATFLAAQAIIRQRSIRLTDEEMLAGLRGLFEERGVLSGLVIDEKENFPSSSAFRTRFGSLLRAYELVGYSPGRDYRYIEINRSLRRMHPNILAEITSEIERLSGSVICDPATDLLTVNGEFTASIVIVRCMTLPTGGLRWKMRFDTGLRPDITIAIRMDADNQHPLDYYLLPRVDVAPGAVRLKEDNSFYWDAYRFETIDHFIWLASRASIRSAA